MIENLDKLHPNEIWEHIQGSEEYAISNFGRIASNKRGFWRVLSQKNSKGDYLSVTLRSGDKCKSTRIHRLVYEAFIGQIPNGHKYHIHHIDGNRQNNEVSNLCLVNCFEHHFLHIEENPSILNGMINYNKYVRTKKIEQYDLSGNYIATYNNGVEASQATGVCRRNILQVAGKEPYNKKGSIRKQAGGYIWKFAEE